MKIAKNLRKGIDNSIKSLTKIYGVNVEIYKPISFLDEQHQYNSDDVEYEDIPYLKDQKVLIPSIFKPQHTNSLAFDNSLNTDELILYIKSTILLYKHSLVVVKPHIDKRTQEIQKMTEIRFIVDESIEISDLDYIIFKKYSIVPVNTMSIDETEYKDEELLKDIDYENNNSLTPIQENDAIEYEFDDEGKRIIDDKDTSNGWLNPL